jgi:hypothetical protein
MKAKVPEGRVAFDELHLSLFEPDVAVQVAELDRFRLHYDRFNRITTLINNRRTYLRIISPFFHFIKGVSRQACKRVLDHHDSKGHPALWRVTKLAFLWMVVEGQFGQWTPVTYSELLHELEFEFGAVPLADALRHILRRIPGCRIVIGMPQEASCKMSCATSRRSIIIVYPERNKANLSATLW